jgi:DnaJ-class molecular chaperone
MPAPVSPDAERLMECPLQWFDCEACGGGGMVSRRISVYERGCGFPHGDEIDEICRKCNGNGGWVDEAEHD